MSNDLVEDYYNSMDDFFQGKVRAVTEADRNVLPRLSYSGLEIYKNCPFQYDLKYNQHKRSYDTTLALELGGLLHKILELRIQYIIKNEPIDYDYLKNILRNGFIEQDEKTKESLSGIDALKKKYWEEWYWIDNKSGMNYEEKMKVFEKAMYHEMEDQSIWHPVYTEMPFEFVYKDRVIFNGFIDRIDMNRFGSYRTVDYKTSRAVFGTDKTNTSLQFGIYALAIYEKFGQIPISHLYRFVLIDEDQAAMTKGWEKRLERTLDAFLDKIDKSRIGIGNVPKPSPLCYYCNFARINPKANEYKYECPYYCLWTPSEKRFDVNRRYNALDNTSKKSTIDTGNKSKLNGKRKLIF